MQSAADELEIVDLHLAGELADEVIGSARSHPAIDRGNDIAAAGELVELEGVLGKKRDVDDVLAALEDGLERVEAHEPGHGADDEIGRLDGIGNGLGVAEIGDLCFDWIARRKRCERIRAHVPRR